MKSEGDQGSNARTFLLRKSEMKSDWNLVKIACRNAPSRPKVNELSESKQSVCC